MIGWVAILLESSTYYLYDSQMPLSWNAMVCSELLDILDQVESWTLKNVMDFDLLHLDFCKSC